MSLLFIGLAHLTANVMSNIQVCVEYRQTANVILHIQVCVEYRQPANVSNIQVFMECRHLSKCVLNARVGEHELCAQKVVSSPV